MRQFSPIFAKLGLLLIIMGCACWITIIPITSQQHKQLTQYFSSIGLDYSIEKFEVEPNLNLYGICYMPIAFKNVSDPLIPLLIHINGANNHKEMSKEYATSMARMGFIVLVLEQRGHGQSGGRFTIYAYEPLDVPKVFDAMCNRYSQINRTHYAASGFSLGAGTMLLAQAFDDRIHATVLYHPPANLSSIIEPFGVTALVGLNFLMPAPYAQANVSLLDDRSPLLYCNSTNTKNLLLLQGELDTMIDPNSTKRTIEAINSENRSDIKYIIRPGLNHGPNEADITSRRYSQAWLSKFFFNDSINIDTPESLLQEAMYQPIYEFNLPSKNDLRPLIFVGLFFIELGLYIFFYFKNQQKFSAHLSLARVSTEDSKQTIKRKTAWYFALMVGLGFILGLIIKFTSPNIIFGLLLGIPACSTFIIWILMLKYNRNSEISVNNAASGIIYPENNSVTSFLYYGLTIGVFLIAYAINDVYCMMILESPVWLWKLTYLLYIFLFVLIIVWSFLNFELFKGNRYGNLFGILGIDLCAIMYLIWNPVPLIFGLNFLTLIVGLIFGVIAFIFAIIHRILTKIFANPLFGSLFISAIAAALIIDRFMAILI